MKKQQLYSPMWISITAILSIVFAVLFFPIAKEHWGAFWSVVSTLAGVAVIWLVYVIRAYIFTSAGWNKRGSDTHSK